MAEASTVPLPGVSLTQGRPSAVRLEPPGPDLPDIQLKAARKGEKGRINRSADEAVTAKCYPFVFGRLFCRAAELRSRLLEQGGVYDPTARPPDSLELTMGSRGLHFRRGRRRCCSPAIQLRLTQMAKKTKRRPKTQLPNNRGRRQKGSTTYRIGSRRRRIGLLLEHGLLVHQLVFLGFVDDAAKAARRLSTFQVGEGHYGIHLAMSFDHLMRGIEKSA